MRWTDEARGHCVEESAGAGPAESELHALASLCASPCAPANSAHPNASPAASVDALSSVDALHRVLTETRDATHALARHLHTLTPRNAPPPGSVVPTKMALALSPALLRLIPTSPPLASPVPSQLPTQDSGNELRSNSTHADDQLRMYTTPAHGAMPSALSTPPARSAAQQQQQATADGEVPNAVDLAQQQQQAAADGEVPNAVDLAHDGGNGGEIADDVDLAHLPDLLDMRSTPRDFRAQLLPAASHDLIDLNTPNPAQHPAHHSLAQHSPVRCLFGTALQLAGPSQQEGGLLDLWQHASLGGTLDALVGESQLGGASQLGGDSQALLSQFGPCVLQQSAPLGGARLNGTSEALGGNSQLGGDTQALVSQAMLSEALLAPFVQQTGALVVALQQHLDRVAGGLYPSVDGLAVVAALTDEVSSANKRCEVYRYELECERSNGGMLNEVRTCAACVLCRVFVCVGAEVCLFGGVLWMFLDNSSACIEQYPG